MQINVCQSSLRQTRVVVGLPYSGKHRYLYLLSSDRITAVQLSICLSVVGVYLHSSYCPIDVYREYIEELESTIAMLQNFGPTIVLGDCTS